MRPLAGDGAREGVAPRRGMCLPETAGRRPRDGGRANAGIDAGASTADRGDFPATPTPA